MMTNHDALRGALALVTIMAAPALAAPPSYDTVDLACRANFSGAFNIPDGVFMNSSTPSLTDTAGVAVSTNGSTDGVWFDAGVPAGTAGVMAWVSPGFMSDVSLNASGLMVAEQTFSAADGVYLIDAFSDPDGLAFGVNLFSGYSSPQINDSGRIAYRGKTGGGDQLFASDVIGGGLSPVIHVAEVGVVPSSPYSFLFTPSFNNADQIAGKARRGAAGVFGESQPDEIRVWNLDGSSVLIAEDTDSDPMSPYASFDNSVSLTDNGFVAFVARLASGGRGVFLSDGTTTTTIATEADAAVSDIEFFAPAANSTGLVAFRAFDGNGQRAVFVGDGAGLTAVATAGDLFETDLGTARLDQNTPTSPVFGGGPAINGAGDVAFLAGVTPPDNNQIEWGTGLFIARASAGGPDFNGDGVVNGADLAILLAAWGSPCPLAAPVCPPDLDGDGNVNGADLAALLAAWG